MPLFILLKHVKGILMPVRPDIVVQQSVIKFLVQRKDFRDSCCRSWSRAQAEVFQSVLYAERHCAMLEFLKYFCFF